MRAATLGLNAEATTFVRRDGDLLLFAVLEGLPCVGTPLEELVRACMLVPGEPRSWPQRVSRAIADHVTASGSRVPPTAAVGAVTADRVAYAWAGDIRVHVHVPAGVWQVERDHTLAQDGPNPEKVDCTRFEHGFEAPESYAACLVRRTLTEGEPVDAFRASSPGGVLAVTL